MYRSLAAEGISTHYNPMLWTVFSVVLALWLLGIVSANTFGGFIHVLLIVAIALVLMRGIQADGTPD